jgi:hypothetical protein
MFLLAVSIYLWLHTSSYLLAEFCFAYYLLYFTVLIYTKEPDQYVNNQMSQMVIRNN